MASELEPRSILLQEPLKQAHSQRSTFVIPPFELPDPDTPIDFPHFIYYPPINPLCAVNNDLAHRSSTLRMPKYMGQKNLARISAKQRDRNRFVLGYPLDRRRVLQRGMFEGFAIDAVGEDNATERFELLLARICGIDTDKDCHPVLMADGTSALCVTFAQNLTRESMSVDVVKLDRVKKFLGTTEHPRWYKYAWDYFHDDSDDEGF